MGRKAHERLAVKRPNAKWDRDNDATELFTKNCRTVSALKGTA